MVVLYGYDYSCYMTGCKGLVVLLLMKVIGYGCVDLTSKYRTLFVVVACHSRFCERLCPYGCVAVVTR